MIQFAFLPNWFKYIGLTMLFAGYFMGFYLHPDFTTVKDGLGLFVQVLILFGFLCLIFSKQKTEDEFINHHRLISLQWAVVILILLRLGYKLIGFITKDESWMPNWQVNSLLLFYVLIFYYKVIVKDWIANLFNRTKNEKHN